MMKIVTINDMCKLARRNKESLLGLSVEKSSNEATSIVEAYNNIYTDVDRRINRENGMFSPAYNIDDCVEDELLEYYSKQDEATAAVLAEFRETVQSYLNTRAVDYRKLFAVQAFDYNPIDNYSMTEESTDRHITSDSETHMTGKQELSTLYGEQSQTIAHGGVTVTSESGERTTQNTYGEQNSTTTQGDRESVTTTGVAGFNSSDFQNSNRSSTSEDAHVDKETVDTHTDNTTQGAYTDTQKTSEQLDKTDFAAHTDKQTSGERTDTNERSGSQDTTHELTRTGNVGVTTTQEMLESEIKLWENYDFWGKFMDDIISKFCTFHDNGYSVLETPIMNELLPFL